MPQNEKLSTHWQNELGQSWKEIHTRYLHTIGNLTLTGYNSELSDRSFQEKRDLEGGFADSPLRLNRGLGKLDCWTEKEIQDRAEALSNLALRIWEYPQLDAKTLESYKQVLVEENGYDISHFEFLKGDMHHLFEAVRTRILNLDSSVREEYKKLYIAYKTSTNFVDIIPQKSRLRLILNMSFDEIQDPEKRCRDITDLGRWGNGDVEVILSSLREIDYVMFLIQQAFEKQMDDFIV